ncbi:MAG TPA: hypothetical protein VHZ95_02655 [Polyangiales bacterium]|nr:hypothetical protein [Polyangiales bacterium]
MNTRPTTLVESDQLALAAASVLRNEDFIPKGKRWPFTRTSKAHRDYDKAVQEVTARRREARESAVERKTKKAKAEADATFERAKSDAQAVHGEKIAEAKKPYDEVEAQARRERDAAIAAANLAYQQTMEKANGTYQQEAATLDQKRDAVVADAKSIHVDAYAAVDAERKVDLTQIAKDLKTIPLEGPMRIVEDRDAWSPEDRRKALIGLLDMAGEETLETEYAELCLRSVAGYVFQDRYLKPDAQHHRLMDANLLEALVELAQRNPERRPSVVRYMYEIVEQSPGHSSPVFIKSLTELYVIASSDTLTTYAPDPIQNETIFETMRAHIADTLKLTPRRSLVPPPAANSGTPREPTTATTATTDDDDHKTPVMARSNADITADVNIGDLLPLETDEAATPVGDAEVAEKPAADAATTSNKPAKRPPPPLQRGARIRTPEGST